MNIAILGWGSLINEPRDLPIKGNWQSDGPELCIEFSRISQRGERADCLTLVIDERCDSTVTVLYVLSKRSNLQQAIEDLRQREGTELNNIGFYQVETERVAPIALRRHPKSCETIQIWAQVKDFDAVIWTALSRRFKDAIGIPFNPSAALNYLNGLCAPTKEKALQYIQNTPPQIMTPFRKLLSAQLEMTTANTRA